MSTPAQDAFNDHAAALRDLGRALSAASSVRNQPAPGTQVGGGKVPNPTLDIVMEPRRLRVSEEITRATIALWPLTTKIHEMTKALDDAVARWEGEPPSHAGSDVAA